MMGFNFSMRNKIIPLPGVDGQLCSSCSPGAYCLLLCQTCPAGLNKFINFCCVTIKIEHQVLIYLMLCWFFLFRLCMCWYYWYQGFMVLTLINIETNVFRICIDCYFSTGTIPKCHRCFKMFIMPCWVHNFSIHNFYSNTCGYVIY